MNINPVTVCEAAHSLLALSWPKLAQRNRLQRKQSWQSHSSITDLPAQHWLSGSASMMRQFSSWC